MHVRAAGRYRLERLMRQQQRRVAVTDESRVRRLEAVVLGPSPVVDELVIANDEQLLARQRSQLFIDGRVRRAHGDIAGADHEVAFADRLPPSFKQRPAHPVDRPERAARSARRGRGDRGADPTRPRRGRRRRPPRGHPHGSPSRRASSASAKGLRARVPEGGPVRPRAGRGTRRRARSSLTLGARPTGALPPWPAAAALTAPPLAEQRSAPPRRTVRATASSTSKPSAGRRPWRLSNIGRSGTTPNGGLLMRGRRESACRWRGRVWQRTPPTQLGQGARHPTTRDARRSSRVHARLRASPCPCLLRQLVLTATACGSP